MPGPALLTTMMNLSFPIARLSAALALTATLALGVGCQTDTAGVRSNQVQQYTSVNASTEEVIDTAKNVLSEYDLKGITGDSTGLDGEAHGKMADGTEVWVTARRESDTMTEVTVQVGTAGDNTLGQEIAGKIREQLIAERM